ncbi:MAG TPA: hypothetical protein V6C97_32980 [Oculatellaceae cyanobacterium]
MCVFVCVCVCEREREREREEISTLIESREGEIAANTLEFQFCSTTKPKLSQNRWYVVKRWHLIGSLKLAPDWTT